MKLKKLFSVALSVLLIVALAGCGGTKDEVASTSDKTTETGASELLSLYDSISTETKYVAMSDLPEIAAKESYTIGVAMTDVSTGWFKALYDHVNEKLRQSIWFSATMTPPCRSIRSIPLSPRALMPLSSIPPTPRRL